MAVRPQRGNQIGKAVNQMNSKLGKRRNGQRARFTRLGGETNGGIGGAEALVVAALDDLEENRSSNV